MRSSLWPIFAVLLLAQYACQRPVNIRTSGDVGFSADSVRFDTLFTGQLSPTKRLFLYNRSGHPLRIASLSVAGGEQADFRLIADGVASQRHTDIELATGDSLYLFFQIQKEVNGNQDIVDRLLVETAGRVDEVVLFAHVLDAYLIRDSIMPCNAVLPTDKPVVVDGIMRVDENCTLTIPSGARLFFTARQNAGDFSFESQVQVLGRLIVSGTAGQPVLFSNFRLGTSFSIDWQETAGQWGGLHFTQFSQGSSLRHVLLRNASVGIRVDSVSLAPPEPKLTLQQVELRNFSNFAILGLGASSSIPEGTPSIWAENVLAYNAGQSVVGLFFGGEYRFANCTFADFQQVPNSGSQPVLALSNYLSFEDDAGQAQRIDYPTQLTLLNSIVWGSQDEEFGTDFRNFGGSTPVLTLSHSLIKATPFDTGGNPNLFNQNPLFFNVGDRDYRLQGNSPAIGAGNASFQPMEDLKGHPRGAPADIGALVFQP